MVKISVIIPIYNKDKNLSKSIESVLKQTYKDFELILINDGSTDSSKQIIEKYKEKDNRIFVEEQLNSGVSFSRNKGIKLAKGDYISFLDADDTWEDSFLEKMIHQIGDNNVCYSGHFINVDGRTRKARNVKYKSGNLLMEFIFNETAPHTNSWLIKKDFINDCNINFPEELNWGEDMLFYIKVLSNDISVQYVDEPLTTYFMKQDNSLSENNLNKIEKDIEWMSKAISYLKNEKKVPSEIINSFYSYRIPTAIVYRINQNIMIENHNILKAKLVKYQYYLDNISFSNGLRSLKLMIVYLKIRIILSLKR